MGLTPTNLSFILVCASLAVVGLLIHYIRRVGQRRDMLCSFGLMAAQFGLLASGLGYRSAEAPLEPTEQFSGVGLGLSLCFAAIAIWREGLRRFREAN